MSSDLWKIYRVESCPACIRGDVRVLLVEGQQTGACPKCGAVVRFVVTVEVAPAGYRRPGEGE